jgi:hypothetical protein
MIRLANRLLLGVTIDGYDIPLDSMGCPYIQMDVADDLGLPVLTMILNDSMGLLDDVVPLASDIHVVISIGLSEESLSHYEWRIYDVIPLNNGKQIMAYGNAPRYAAEPASKSIRGTSKEVLRQLATDVGLGYDLVDTNDLQVWRPAGKRHINFARYVCAHSAATPDSVMAAAITANGVLRLRDLNTTPQPVATLGYKSDYIPVREFVAHNRGSNNLLGGYSRSMITQSQDGAVTVTDSLNMSIVGRRNAHSRMGAHIRGGLSDFSPVMHPKNVHPLYTHAQYNNGRGRNLFNVECLVSYMSRTNLEPFDWITLDMSAGQGSTDLKRELLIHNGLWCIMDKSVYVENFNYYERLTLRRTGLGVDYNEAN